MHCWDLTCFAGREEELVVDVGGEAITVNHSEHDNPNNAPR